MSGVLFAAALSCLGAGGVLDVVTVARRRSRLVGTVPYVLGVAASALFLAVGIGALASGGSTVDAGDVFGIGRTALRLDALAGMFLTLLFGVGVLVSASAASWAWAHGGRAQRRGTSAGYLLMLASVATVCAAADAFVFLFAWEALTVAFYVLTAVNRADDRQAGASWSAAGAGKASGAGLLLGFLLLAAKSSSLTIASWHGIGAGGVLDAAWVLLIVGFGAKMGLVPFELWVPSAYPAAPGPVRAAMAGMAATIGAYGLWRILGTLAPPPVWLVVVVLLAGGTTALLGIAFAAVQSRLSQVIAYSSVENAGIIVTAYGVALTGEVVHLVPLEVMGLLAATLQAVAHAVAKASLFSSVAFVETAVGTDELGALAGVGRRLPWSGVAFGAGALALAGMPPTIGFVSEWFVLEALMQQFRLHDLALRLGLAGAGALVALTTGLAAFTFLRVLGLVYLGKPAADDRPVRDAGLVGKFGLVGLATACLALAALSPWEFRVIARGLAPLVPHAVALHALDMPWVLQPVFGGFSILSPSWLWIAMPLAWFGVLAMAVAFSRGRYLRPRRVPAWRSATAGTEGPSSYSAFGFANPLRHMLANVLGTRRRREVVHIGEGDEAATRLEAGTTVAEPVRAYVYRPAVKAALAVSGAVRRVQSGRLGTYVAYMLVALVVALAVAAALR